MTSIGTSLAGPHGPADQPSSLPGEGDGLLDGRDFAGRQILGTRAVQEDSYGVVPRAEFEGGARDLFLVVADGMGGHAAGEVASSLAVDTFAETFLESSTACDAGRLWDCLEEANRRIAREIGARGKSIEGMGTTLLAVLLRDSSVRWMSVGDSPLYLVREGAARRLNRIHSKATDLADKVLAGEISEAEAREDPERHVLMSALIGTTIYEVDDPEPVSLTAGDVLVAATDGINSLTDEEIAEVVSAHAGNCAAAVADALLDAVCAMKLPKQDNTTVVVIRMPA